jgi:Uma2 family endonuclease
MSSTFLTPAEYLLFERASERRNEYIDGQVFPMPGSNRWRNRIRGNLASEILQQLRRKPHEVYMAAMRVKVTAEIYMYPDIVAVCGESRFEDSQEDTLLNPAVVMEVLSDRDEKFAHYRRLASLREYVLVAQDKIRIEHYRRDGDQWIFSEVGDVLELPAIECRIDVAAIYEKVTFD